MTRHIDPYWMEAVQCALDEAGLAASEDQVSSIAGAIEGAHEMHGEATGQHVFATNRVAELDREKRDLRAEINWERDKHACPTCGGRGRLITNFGTMSSNSECHSCRGEGKVNPTPLQYYKRHALIATS